MSAPTIRYKTRRFQPRHKHCALATHIIQSALWRGGGRDRRSRQSQSG